MKPKQTPKLKPPEQPLQRRPGGQCAVCKHPDVGAINAAILSKESDSDLGRQYGIGRQSIANHRRRHLPITVTDAIARMDARDTGPLALALAQQAERLQRQQVRYDRMMQIMDERGEDMADVPGGRTGLIVCKYKQVGSGPDAQVLEEYSVDTAFLKEVRELEKQISEELGQYHRQHAGESSKGGPSVLIFKPQVSVEQVRRELPVAEVLEHPEGKPVGYIEPGDIVEGDADAIQYGNPEEEDSPEADGERGLLF